MLERTAPTWYSPNDPITFTLWKDSRLSLTSCYLCLLLIPILPPLSKNLRYLPLCGFQRLLRGFQRLPRGFQRLLRGFLSPISGSIPRPESSTLRSSDQPPPALGSRPPDDSLPGQLHSPVLPQPSTNQKRGVTYLVRPAPASRPIPTPHSPGRFAAHLQHPSHSHSTRIHSLFSTHTSFTHPHALKHFPHLGP